MMLKNNSSVVSILIFGVVMIATPVCAGQGIHQQQELYRQQARQAQMRASKMISPYLSEATMWEKSAILQRTEATNLRPAKEADSSALPIFIFVSFSMPSQSLVTYLRDANKVHAHVVVRGCVNNSLKTTFQTITPLVQAAGGGGIDINPAAFQCFQITHVPSVVVLSNPLPCTAQQRYTAAHDYDMLSGDISLTKALTILRDQGDVGQNSAAQALRRLTEPQHA